MKYLRAFFQAALCMCLAWLAVEIVICLIYSRSFRWLSVPVGILLAAAGSTATVAIVNSGRRFLLIISGLAVLNALIAALAVWTALAINPSYEFSHAPLVKLSFVLLRHLSWI
ncbi:MAG: hypothetical protein JO051_17010 [Acidobacteriaceae bacterium]|nr:hypothetical protein [Acidobacteriaceae bacterium]